MVQHRILHILHSMNRGGTEAMLMNYYRHIDREKVQFDFLLTCQDHCQYEDEIIALGGQVFRVPLLTINPIPYIMGVRSFLKNHPEYRIVHSHTSSKSAVPLWVAKRCGVPVRICHAHSSSSGKGLEGMVRGLLGIWLKRVATDFMACGEGAARCWYGDDYYEAGKVKIVPNAIDLKKFAFDQQVRHLVRAHYNLTDDVIVLGMVSRFHPVKNHLFSLSLLQTLIQSGLNVVLMLVGDGELRAQLEEQTEKLDIKKHLVFAGEVSDVFRYVQAIDIMLMPSFNEGLPVSLIEAQASGMKCVVSTGVPKEVNVTGNVVFHPLVLDDWKDTIKELIDNDYIRDFEAITQIENAGYSIVHASKSLLSYYEGVKK